MSSDADLPDSKDVTHLPPLTSPDDVGRAALRRVRAAARERGAVPGKSRRRGIAGVPAIRGGSGSGASARDPQLLGDSLSFLVQGQGWAENVSVGSVVGRWREVVGDDIADHCEPEAFDQRVLTVRASSTAWATQLSLLSGQILAAIARSVGEGMVDEIVVRGPRGPGFGRGYRSVRGRGVRDTFG